MPVSTRLSLATERRQAKEIEKYRSSIRGKGLARLLHLLKDDIRQMQAQDLSIAEQVRILEEITNSQIPYEHYRQWFKRNITGEYSKKHIKTSTTPLTSSDTIGDHLCMSGDLDQLIEDEEYNDFFYKLSEDYQYSLEEEAEWQNKFDEDDAKYETHLHDMAFGIGRNPGNISEATGSEIQDEENITDT